MKTFYSLLFLSLITLIPGNKLNAQAGSLDLSFSSDGKVTTPIGAAYDIVQALAIQSDGKIIAAGFTGTNAWDNDFALVRYNADGSLDLTFGIAGMAVLDVGGGYDRCSAIGIQSDGKIVAAGYAYIANRDFALVRLNANGTLDNSFDGDGMVTTDFGSWDEIMCISFQSDGKIVAAGSSNDDFAVARYNSNGTLDNSFDSDGKVTTNFNFSTAGLTYDFGYSLVIQSDGKIVVSGQTENEFGSDFGMVRYTATGALDNTFGASGKVVTDLGSVYDESYSIALQSDGKIVSAGLGYDGAFYTFALVRYNSDGTLDNGFDGDGKVFTSIASGDICRSLGIQADGKILVAGSSSSGSNKDFALLRYTANGSLDNSFDYDGKAFADFGSIDDAYTLAIQPDGQIIVAGEATVGAAQDFALARFNATGALNVAENANQTPVTAMPNPFANELTLNGTQAKGEIRIFDVTGKELVQRMASEGQTKIDLESFRSGYYVLNYKTEEKTVSIKVLKF